MSNESGQPKSQRRGGTAAVAVAALGLVPALPWLLVTAIETDSGWEDAIWQYPSWSKTMAWIITICGAGAAISALIFARRLRSATGRRSRTWFNASITGELAMLAAWVALIYTAPS